MTNGTGNEGRLRTTIAALSRLITALGYGIVELSRRGVSLRRSPLRPRVASSPGKAVRLLVRSPAVGSVALIVVATSALAIAPPEAVGSLYLRATGQYLCTASVVDGPELGLDAERVVLTAAHCVEPYLVPDSGGQGWSSREAYEVGLGGTERFAVAPLRVGFADAGYDLALLGFVADVPEVAPLRMGSWEGVDFGTVIENYANPLGLGIQYFRGSVTMLRIEPSGSGARRQWFLNAVAALQVGPGSSGSLILTGAWEYVGVLSGVVEARFGSPFTVFVPLWRIPEFLNFDGAGRDVRCGACPGQRALRGWGDLVAVLER